MNQPTTPNTVEDFLPLPEPVRMSSDQAYLGYTADQVHAAILADRAQRPVAASGVDVRKARTEGRAEALAILLSLEPETQLDEYVSSSALGDSGDYTSHWDEDALRKLFSVDDATYDAFDRAEAAYWEYLGYKDEAQRAQAFAANMHNSGAVRAALAKHREFDLMANLCTEQPASPTVAGSVDTDERYEFERHMSNEGESVNYLGDGLYGCGHVQDRWDTWKASAALSRTPAAPVVAEGVRQEFIRQIVLSVAEIPDRDSPDDQPEMMLVTGDELRNIITSAFESADERVAPAVVAEGLTEFLTELAKWGGKGGMQKANDFIARAQTILAAHPVAGSPADDNEGAAHDVESTSAVWERDYAAEPMPATDGVLTDEQMKFLKLWAGLDKDPGKWPEHFMHAWTGWLAHARIEPMPASEAAKLRNFDNSQVLLDCDSALRAEPASQRCISPLATRPILYTDTVNGVQTCRDDLWAVTTEELNVLATRCRAEGGSTNDSTTNLAAPAAPTDAKQAMSEVWQVLLDAGVCPGTEPMCLADGIRTALTAAQSVRDALEKTELDGWNAAAKALAERAAGHFRMENYELQDECLQCASMLHDLKPVTAIRALIQSPQAPGKEA